MTEKTFKPPWQPMSTAPKDGTRILAWFAWPIKKTCYVVSWQSNNYEFIDNWTLDEGQSASLSYDPPCAWMPLPDAPEEMP